MKRKNILLILYLAIVSLGFARLVQRSLHAASNPRLKEAPAAFATPLLAQNPGSQSVSNGIPEPSNDTFALDQAKFEGAVGGFGRSLFSGPPRSQVRARAREAPSLVRGKIS